MYSRGGHQQKAATEAMKTVVEGGLALSREGHERKIDDEAVKDKIMNVEAVDSELIQEKDMSSGSSKK